jgi:hypothetical protein
MQPPVKPLEANALTVEQERSLDERIDGLRAETEALAAPMHVEVRLMAAFKAHHKKSRALTRRREFIAQWFAPGFALAASVGMSAWMALVPLLEPLPDTAMSVADVRIDTETPFIALQSLEQIALEPQPHLIKANVPRMMLASYGVPVNPESAGDSVRAEMLVSASGQALAMRFVP